MNKRQLFFVVLLASLLILPGVLQAFNIGKLSFYVTNEFQYQNNKLAEKKGQYYESLSLFANYGNWSMGMTVRGNNFYKQTPNVTLEDGNFDLYRKYVQYTSRNLEITVGDFYSNLGRGMVLSVLKNDEVLRERTILGGSFHYHKGNLDFKALGGRVKDETENQEWDVAGGELIYQLVKNHRIGVHVSYIDDVESYTELGKRLTYSASIQGNKLFKYFSYYTEVAVMNFQDEKMENGYGIFSSLAFNKGHWNAFLEFKRYKDFDNELNNPPIADRIDEIAPFNDTTGLRLYLQYSFFEPDITIFFNAGRYKEYDFEGWHFFGGVTMEDLMDRLSFSATYGVKDIRYPIYRLDSHMVYQFTDNLSIELNLKHKKYTFQSFKFDEQDHGVEIAYSPYVSVFFLHQFSHNKVIDLNHFYSGGVKFYLSSATSIEVSGGTMRGGQICSGGQCYVAPPFKGIKCGVLHTFR